MKRHLTRALRLTITVLIIAMLVVFATKVNWHSTWAAIEDSSISILLAAALVNLLVARVEGRALVDLSSANRRDVAVARAYRRRSPAPGLNNVLVANSGEAARVIFVARAAHVTSAKVLATLALERMFELIGYIVMLALSVSFLPAARRPRAHTASRLARARPDGRDARVSRTASRGPRADARGHWRWLAIKSASVHAADSCTRSAGSRPVRASASRSRSPSASGRSRSRRTRSRPSRHTSTCRSSARWRRSSP